MLAHGDKVVDPMNEGDREGSCNQRGRVRGCIMEVGVRGCIMEVGQCDGGVEFCLASHGIAHFTCRSLALKTILVLTSQQVGGTWG